MGLHVSPNLAGASAGLTGARRQNACQLFRCRAATTGQPFFTTASTKSLAVKILGLRAHSYRMEPCSVKAAAYWLLDLGTKTKCYGDMRARIVHDTYTIRGVVGLLWRAKGKGGAVVVWVVPCCKWTQWFCAGGSRWYGRQRSGLARRVLPRPLQPTDVRTSGVADAGDPSCRPWACSTLR